MTIRRSLGRISVVVLVGCNALVGNETVQYVDASTKPVDVNETTDDPGTTSPPPAEDGGTVGPVVGDDEDAGPILDNEGGS